MAKKDKSDVELKWEKERKQMESPSIYATQYMCEILEWKKERKQMESDYRMQSRQLHKKKSKFK